MILPVSLSCRHRPRNWREGCSRDSDSADGCCTYGEGTDEISHWPEYDYIIVNYDIEDSVAQVQAILAAERLKQERQTGLTDFKTSS